MNHYFRFRIIRLQWFTNSMDMNLGKLLETVKDRGAWHAAVHRVTELDVTNQLNNSGSILQVRIKDAGTSLPSQLFMVGSIDPKGTTFQKTAELMTNHVFSSLSDFLL